MGDFRTEEQVMKTLHIIVRHRANPNPKYANQWLDDDRILSIVTYSEIADLCGYALASEAPVRIHRTGTSTEAPAVCCEAKSRQSGQWAHSLKWNLLTRERCIWHLHFFPTARNPGTSRRWHTSHPAKRRSRPLRQRRMGCPSRPQPGNLQALANCVRDQVTWKCSKKASTFGTSHANPNRM